MLDTSYHDRLLATLLQDPVFRAEFEHQYNALVAQHGQSMPRRPTGQGA